MVEYRLSKPTVTSSTLVARSTYAGVTQLVEYLFCKQEVVGSYPTSSSKENNGTVAQLVEHGPFKPMVVGSYPTRPTTLQDYSSVG